jgi:hypothetical protein
MTQQEWERSLARSTVGGDAWYGYVYWLRDDAEDGARASAMEWLLENGKYPYLDTDARWLWVPDDWGLSPVQWRDGSPPEHCKLPVDVWVRLEAWCTLSGAKQYISRTSAMMAALDARAQDVAECRRWKTCRFGWFAQERTV